MGLVQSYRLRLQRKRWRIRAFRKRHELKTVANRTGQIRPDDLLLFCTQRNEGIRLPYFLKYYRDLGIGHFFFVDNDSTDGSRAYLAEQPDVSVHLTLNDRVVEKSLAKAEETLKKAITAQDQDKLVDEYLDKVVA